MGGELPQRILAVLGLLIFSNSAQAGETVRLKNQTLKLSRQEIKIRSNPTLAIAPRFSPVLDRVYYILQFDGPIQNVWKQSLSSKGVRFSSYLPDDAFLAYVASPEAWLALNGEKHVKNVVPFETRFRLSNELSASGYTSQATPQYTSIKLADESEILPFLKNAKLRQIPFIIQKISPRLLVLQVLPVYIPSLADIEGVEWVEPFHQLENFNFGQSPGGNIQNNGLDPGPQINPSQPIIHEPRDYSDLTGFESGTKIMGFDAAYANGLDGTGEVVAIADTGVDRGSITNILEDLKDRIIKGYILGPFSESWEDPSGHGTHAAGLIVGRGLSSGGRVHGSAYGAKLVVESLWSPAVAKLTITPDFELLFGRPHNETGAHIHSNSWGNPNATGEYDIFASMADGISWEYPDLLIVFAVGNGGGDWNSDGHIDEGSVASPSTAKNSLSVGASENLVLSGGTQESVGAIKSMLTQNRWTAEPIKSDLWSNNAEGMAAFSGTGPTSDGRIKPEVVAPGTNILSVRSSKTLTANSEESMGVLGRIYNDKYVFDGGTSMSVPLTSGAAAVVRQYLKSLGYQSPSAALIKAILVHSAHDMYPGQFGFGSQQELRVQRPEMHEGFGRVDVAAAVTLEKKSLHDEVVGIKTGEEKVFSLNSNQGEHFVATLCYTDAPGSPSAAAALVNDIDLMVTDSLGKKYFPNHRTRPDDVNNTEVIEFDTIAEGPISVKISGRNVPQGRPGSGAQPFALVISMSAKKSK